MGVGGRNILVRREKEEGDRREGEREIEMGWGGWRMRRGRVR